MLTFPNIDPVAFSVGPLTVHWYGLTYLASFALIWWLALRRAGQLGSPVKPAQIEDIIFYGAIGVIVGGRLGSAIFYNLERLLSDPLWLFRLWEGGMAFHGGLIGVTLAMWICSRRRNIHFLSMMDFASPLVPIGLFFGRLGNFIGQELWGRPTEGWWGMVFPNDPLQLPRHASQLYEAVLEGVALFVILNLVRERATKRGMLSALFLIFYAVFRFVVEFAREPDAHIEFLLFGWMTRGQILCIPMLILGLAVLLYAIVFSPENTSSKRVNSKK